MACQADAAVAVFVVAPLKEAQAEGAGVLDRSEPLGEGRMIFHGLELAFREGIVIGLVGPGMAFTDAQAGQQQRRRCCGHGSAPVGVDGQGSRADAVTLAGLRDQAGGQGAMPPSNLAGHRMGHHAFRDDSGLLLKRSAPPPLRIAENFPASIGVLNNWQMIHRRPPNGSPISPKSRR